MDGIYSTSGIKRSADDFLSMASNGASAYTIQMDTEMTETKKIRMECKPSRVLHIRYVPPDTTEAEIIQLGLPFGRITNLILALKKNQALIEMADVETAQAMLSYYTEKPPSLKGRHVHLQFSNHEQLTTESSGKNAGAQAALNAAQQLMGKLDDSGVVLHIIIEHMLYPITIDILKQLFSKYGQVQKIITFHKNGQFQALIQFSDAVGAHTARMSLNGQNIYNGCCTLRVDFSKLHELNVRFNNEKTRDYTNPNLPSGEVEQPPEPQQMFNIGRGGPGILGVPSSAPLISGFGGVTGGMGFGSGSMFEGEMANNFNAGNAFTGFSGGMPRFGADFGAMTGGMSRMSHEGCVVIVSNLNEQKITPDVLFTLFGVYGDVIHVKIMFQKKDTALIEFADAGQARTAISNLSNLELWGKTIKVALSKHSSVRLPSSKQEDSGLTKDYTGSPLHRFKNPQSKNFQNIFPPSKTLHLSNIPASIGEDDLRRLFSQYGNVEAFKFFPKDRKMALIQLGTVEEAIESLIELHNHALGEKTHLRVSFSRSTVNRAGVE